MNEGSRVVYQEDALAWLEREGAVAGRSFVTSLPDFSEFPSLSLSQWRDWFTGAASRVMACTPPEGLAIFYQRDIKVEGEWVDKSYLVQKAAERAGHKLLWHKLVARVPPGQILFGKPGYSHLLAFSAGFTPDLAHATRDILPVPGKTSWPRGMGLEVCKEVCEFLIKRTTTNTIVAPFCGEGALLAVANRLGLHAIGIELSRKRAERAREITLASLRAEL